jgi:hypothetical protein
MENKRIARCVQQRATHCHLTEWSALNPYGIPDVPVDEKGSSKLLRKIKLIPITLVALAGLIIAMLDMFNIIDNVETTPYIGVFIKNFHIITLSLIAIELVTERYITLDKVDDLIDSIEKKDMVAKIELMVKSLSDFERRFSQVNAFFGLLTKSQRFQILSFKYSMQSFSKIIDEETFIISEAETLNVWRDCILEAKDWYALSYAKDAWGINDGFGDVISFDYQKLRIETGGEIRRVFIIDTKQEYYSLKEVMQEQENINIKVKWIFKSELAKYPIINRNIHDIGTWDFSLVDNQSMIFKFQLDEDNNISGCAVTINADILSKGLRVFNEAWTRGRLPSIEPS